MLPSAVQFQTPCPNLLVSAGNCPFFFKEQAEDTSACPFPAGHGPFYLFITKEEESFLFIIKEEFIFITKNAFSFMF